MAFYIPNRLDSIEDPAASGKYPQAQIDNVDVDALVMGLEGYVVASGCTVTAHGTPDQAVAVAAGTVRSPTATQTISAVDPLNLSVAHATLSRFDVIVASVVADSVNIVEGTAATIPTFPELGANKVFLAAILRPAAVHTVGTIGGFPQIIDKRVIGGGSSKHQYVFTLGPVGGVDVVTGVQKQYHLIGDGAETITRISVFSGAAPDSDLAFDIELSGTNYKVTGFAKPTNGTITVTGTDAADHQDYTQTSTLPALTSSRVMRINIPTTPPAGWQDVNVIIEVSRATV